MYVYTKVKNSLHSKIAGAKQFLSVIGISYLASFLSLSTKLQGVVNRANKTINLFACNIDKCLSIKINLLPNLAINT